MSNSVESLEILKTLQTTLTFLVKQQEEASVKERGYKLVESYKRNKVELITCKEASKIYPIGETKFRQLCKSSALGFPSIQIGCRHYIIKDRLDDWLRENVGRCL